MGNRDSLRRVGKAPFELRFEVACGVRLLSWPWLTQMLVLPRPTAPFIFFILFCPFFVPFWAPFRSLFWVPWVRAGVRWLGLWLWRGRWASSNNATRSSRPPQISNLSMVFEPKTNLNSVVLKPDQPESSRWEILWQTDGHSMRSDGGVRPSQAARKGKWIHRLHQPGCQAHRVHLWGDGRLYDWICLNVL